MPRLVQQLSLYSLRLEASLRNREGSLAVISSVCCLGSLCALIPQPSFLATIIVYSLAVGISILLMVALDVEHPPASGTALGIASSSFSTSAVIAVLTSSILLSLAHRLSKKYLRDLT